MPYVIKINGQAVTPAEYEAYRKRNEKLLKDNFNDIVRSRKPPGLKGDDTTFLSAFRSLESEHGTEGAELIVSEARKHGYNPSPNDVYMPTAARFTGDPGAFFNGGRGRAALKHQIEHTIGCQVDTEGWVDTKGVERPPAENVELAQDIVDQIYERESALDPDFARADPHEAKFHIREHFKRKAP